LAATISVEVHCAARRVAGYYVWESFSDLGARGEIAERIGSRPEARRQRRNVSLVILELVGGEFGSPAVDFNVHVAKLVLVDRLPSEGPVVGQPASPWGIEGYRRVVDFAYSDHADEHSDDIVAAPGPEAAALGVVNAFQDAWNRRDLTGMDAAFHFPHVRIANGRIRFMDRGSHGDDFFERFIAQTGWDYSLWDYRHSVQSTNDKVHFAVQFSRYRADGTLIGRYPSMWIVALIDGRWGVQARSSFAP